MTSDANEYIPIAEGIYDCNYMDPGKGGKLPSHWALNNAGIVPTMDGRIQVLMLVIIIICHRKRESIFIGLIEMALRCGCFCRMLTPNPN